MSASSKKKLRNERNAAAMTERQQQEAREAKKLRSYTILFTVAIVVMLVVVIATSVYESGIIQRSTTALTVGDSKVSAAELNHYYVDTVNNYVNQAGDYITLFGLDPTVPMDEQYFNEEEGQTWSDYFLASAQDTAQVMYAYYNAAMAEGFTMSEASQANIDATIGNFAMYASINGMSTDAYIAAIYGDGCNEDTMRHYAEVQMIASEFMNAKMASLSYTDEELRALEAENYNAYSSFSYNYYYLAASKFYEGGVTDEETGTTQYSDAEKEAGRAACEAAAKTLLTATTAEELDAAVAALEINAESTTAKSTRHDNYLYTNVNATLREWVCADNRKAGDITLIPNESTSTDADGNETKTVAGYYVVRFDGSDANLMNLVNVRHILITPEGGSYDSTTGTTTYTDEEKSAAKAKAEELLAQFKAGDATEEAFAELANKNSADGDGTTGGLYENVYPGQMVASFNDWCFDATRKTGDTGVVESTYGYHVMYFAGKAETTYRDYMIETELRNSDMAEFETGLIESNPVTVKNTSHIKGDLVLSSAS